MLDKGFQFGIETFGILRLCVNDLLVNVHWIIVDERSVASVHFINQDTEAPPVDRLGVTSVQQNFGSDVFGGSADSVSSLLDDLGKTVIDKFEVSIFADHDVFGLQISVYDVLAMEVLEHGGNLGAVKSTLKLEILRITY